MWWIIFMTIFAICLIVKSYNRSKIPARRKHKRYKCEYDGYNWNGYRWYDGYNLNE